MLKIKSGSNLYINITNPYPDPMKYSVALMPNIVVAKAKDYFTYLKYAKR